MILVQTEKLRNGDECFNEIAISRKGDKPINGHTIDAMPMTTRPSSASSLRRYNLNNGNKDTIYKYYYSINAQSSGQSKTDKYVY